MWHVDLAEGEQSFEAEAATLDEARRRLDEKIPDGWIRIWNAKVLSERNPARIAQIAAPVEAALRSRSARARAAAVRELARGMAGGTIDRGAAFDAIVAALASPSGEVHEAVILALRDSGDARAAAILMQIATTSRPQAARAVRTLESLVRETPGWIGDSDLESLAALHAEQTDLSPEAGTDRKARSIPVDCSTLNELARRELARRRAGARLECGS